MCTKRRRHHCYFHFPITTAKHPSACVCVCVFRAVRTVSGGPTAKILVGPYCNCLAFTFSMYLVDKTSHSLFIILLTHSIRIYSSKIYVRGTRRRDRPREICTYIFYCLVSITVVRLTLSPSVPFHVFSRARTPCTRPATGLCLCLCSLLANCCDLLIYSRRTAATEEELFSARVALF